MCGQGVIAVGCAAGDDPMPRSSLLYQGQRWRECRQRFCRLTEQRVSYEEVAKEFLRASVPPAKQLADGWGEVDGEKENRVTGSFPGRGLPYPLACAMHSNLIQDCEVMI
ncbi:unnamed protein product [Nippostrongylus brasiliensis]|uniref:Homeobox domain-containing protein n=1 Tax=Nippostrongylus brasiliensis TaxID=27835 RepID=A0A0N4YK08_NIPBR|nr:unnamed protein product [Nippostrongylus brasiliensis]